MPKPPIPPDHHRLKPKHRDGSGQFKAPPASKPQPISPCDDPDAMDGAADRYQQETGYAPDDPDRP